MRQSFAPKTIPVQHMQQSYLTGWSTKCKWWVTDDEIASIL